MKNSLKFKIGDRLKYLGAINEATTIIITELDEFFYHYRVMGTDFISHNTFDIVEKSYKLDNKMEENLNKEYEPKFEIRDFVTSKLGGGVFEIKAISHSFNAGDKNGTYYYEIYDTNGKKHECESKQFDEDYQIYDLSPEEATRFEYRKGVEIKNGDYIIKDSGLPRRKFLGSTERDSDDGKPRYSLIPPLALKRVANLYTNGAKKYKPYNWCGEEGNELEKSGMNFSVMYDSILRHVMAFGLNDKNDKEDHLAAAVFGLMGIMHFEETGRKDLDDMHVWKSSEL